MDSYETALIHLIDEALKEDVGEGDHSALSAISADAKGRAILKIKEEAILAGMKVAETIFKHVEPSANFKPFKKDGEAVKSGEIAFEVAATVHTILKCERLVLNCMQRMSGIATLTHKYTDKLKPYRTKLLDTRKTTPNFRLLEKEAVRIGGGLNHRMGLYDMIMLKDNHIDYAGGIELAIEKAYNYVRSKKPGLKIEVETRNLDEVKQAVSTGKVDRIMLDNFKPAEISEALKLIPAGCETEASGGINLSNVVDYAKAGVTYVSIGAVIHHAVSIDLSLKAEPL
ncbi:MAG: nicotinate-nucleotide diphosphorylase (carboxylating) [Bacteroidetes bacterium]|nr:MAG: nicotinate-nucleotide diphosphorylase (carboxylating) [Bacteroidota bacterium]